MKLRILLSLQLPEIVPDAADIWNPIRIFDAAANHGLFLLFTLTEHPSQGLFQYLNRF